MNKQIEEMASDIAAMCPDLVDSGCGDLSCVACLAKGLEQIGYCKQEWISVDDRLPEECGMPVLMVAVNQYSQTRVVKGFTDYQCPITFHTNEREYDGVWGAWDVTHWMPLPEVPKKVGAET